MSPEMVSLSFELPGFRVARNIGVVRGIVVRSRSIVGNMGAAFQTLVRGNITIYTNLCEQAPASVPDDVRAAKPRRQCRVMMRYDATEIMGGVTEVICYGSAVEVEAAR